MPRYFKLLLKVIFAGLMVWYVLAQIQLHDSVVTTIEPTQTLAGHLLGDWQSETWQFQPTDERPLIAHGQGWEARPGFFTVMREIRLGWVAVGLAAWVFLLLIVSLRWKILLDAVGIPTSFGRSLRLCFIGYFFNNVMPGLTGGDILRAVFVTRGLSENRTRAAMSVLVDRVIGLFALVMIAAVVLTWLRFQDNWGAIPSLARVARGVYLVVGVAALGGAIYLSRRARNFLRFDALLKRLPAQERLGLIDDSLTIYRERPWATARAVFLSFPIHLCGIFTFFCMGLALGAPLGFADELVIYPVVQTVSSIPIAPAGWGIGEGLYGFFFQQYGSLFTLGVDVSILFRLCTQVGFGLIGGLVWVLSRERRDPSLNDPN